MLKIESQRVGENRIEISDQEADIKWIFEEGEDSLEYVEMVQRGNSFSEDQIDIGMLDLEIIEEAESLSELEV